MEAPPVVSLGRGTLVGISPPAGIRGVDELGAVEVELDCDGLPAVIRPLAGWSHAAREGRAGPAISAAFTAAQWRHVAATAGPLRAALTRRSVPTHPAPPPPPREGGPRWPSVARMLDHAEQIMAAPAVPVVGVGRSAGSPTAVTVRLGMPATLSCTLDPAWAIAATPAQAATALAHALADAHRALHAATAAGATAALADLAAATLDHLHTLLAAARQIVIPEVAMDLAVHPWRRKIVGCARDDAGRSLVLVSPF